LTWGKFTKKAASCFEYIFAAPARLKKALFFGSVIQAGISRTRLLLHSPRFGGQICADFRRRFFYLYEGEFSNKFHNNNYSFFNLCKSA
jgi:hypothetical protein